MRTVSTDGDHSGDIQLVLEHANAVYVGNEGVATGPDQCLHAGVPAHEVDRAVILIQEHHLAAHLERFEEVGRLGSGRDLKNARRSRPAAYRPSSAAMRMADESVTTSSRPSPGM